MTGAGVLEAFRREVGPTEAGPVVAVGGRTQWELGGQVDPAAREVAAPSGVVAHQPGEMIVRVRAGTTLAELESATATGGQFVALEASDPERATVGGLLASGQSGVRRLGWGPARDAVLEVTAVTAQGELIKAGAPLVKNVTGFDLCRLFVGSLGTLGLLAEVVLRCRPRLEMERWWRADDADPFEVFSRLYRPLAVLWDGTATWVGLSGYSADVEAQSRSRLGSGFEAVDGPPPLPGSHRRSLAPGALRRLLGAGPGGGGPGGGGPGGGGPGRVRGRWLAEIGVGVVHCDQVAAESIPVVPAGAGVVELHRRIKERFDPAGRLAPGRSPLKARAGVMAS